MLEHSAGRNPSEAPTQMSFDFTEDLAELEALER